MATEASDQPIDPDRTADPAATFRIVGVGASAGGLESLERFFAHLPTDTGMAFVVLQHLSPDFKSLMDELLARRTSLRIRQAEHEMSVEPDTIYLLPPMKEMIIQDRKLLLSTRDPRHGLALPIDHFFRSLAQDVGDRAVAVVLSGSGSDGSRGIQEVSRAGGVVFCESPDTAKFNGMPLSAIGTGLVDQVLPPEQIATAVDGLRRPIFGLSTADDGAGGDDIGVNAVLRLLRDEYGIDFSHYKTTTVTRRIERRLALNQSLDLDIYVDRLRRDPRELNSLYEDLLIGVTRFFRDDDAFAMLEQRVIPDIIERTAQSDEGLRIWVAGCATGQEAYSIAMLFHEQLAARRRPVNVKILATDVHKASLEVAGAGIYAESELAGVSAERLERFFTRKPNGFQVSAALRETIVFAPHNLIRDSPFTKLDLISCRNLLIYFQPPAQKTVLTLFHFALKTGGFLFLGSSESLGLLLDEFDVVDDHAKVFRKRRDIGLPADLKLPLPRAGGAALAPSMTRNPAVSPQLLAAYDRLLERYMPPSFLVDERGQLVDSYGGIESMLKVKGRRPTQQLVEMLGDDLRAVVSGALYRVRKDGERAQYDGVQVHGHAGRWSLVAEPLRDPHGTQTHVLISMTGPDGAVVASSALAPAAAAARVGESLGDVDLTALSQDRMRVLQDELSYTKENLQATVEELESANEELQATNEELVASNEELQSTNEELHSVNEELYTVNAEYQKKNGELLAASDDIEHLLNGTDVGTLFLDRDLCIRKFTPRIAETFQVIPYDVGRPLATFVHDLAHPTLMADIERVLASGTPYEAPTSDGRGHHYFLRILPYRGRHHSPDGDAGRRADPDGVVITLTDISALEQARARVAQLSAIVESSDDAIVGTTVDGIVTSWNNGAARLFGYSSQESIGRHISFLSPPGQKEAVHDIITQVREGRSVDRLETTRIRRDGTTVDVASTFSPIFDAEESVVGVSAISHDITPLVRARDEIADRQEQIRLLLDSTAEAIYGVDLNGVCTFCNAACARLLGYDSPDAIVGTRIHGLIHHTHADGAPYPAEQSPIYDTMRHRREAHVDNEVLWRADGSRFPAEYWSHPIVRNGELIGAVVTFLDITERRKAEDEIQEGVRRREQFLAMLSHELRNPLAAILSATRLLGRASWNMSSCQEAGEVVERQAQHMTRLLDDLLDVARITHGRIVLRPQTMDLRDAARSAIESLGPLMADRDTNLAVELCPEPLLVHGDPARLQQVLANLLSNASKYTPAGGHVRVELRREGEEALIRVIDDGRGIDANLLPRIFDLFVQGEQSIARSEGGLGIGLTLLRTLVGLHDGRIDVHSDGPGKGSVFRVWLPLVAPDSAADVAPRGLRAADVNTIVIVEDQADSRRMLELMFASDGRTVHTADNGLAGVELIERLRPDLAIVDLGLPVISGFELAQRVRRNPGLAGTRLVALSGYGQDSDVQAALAAGFDEHLTKPPDPERLEALLTTRHGRES